MSVRPRKPRESVIVAAVSGGPDSVYLFHKTVASGKGARVVVGHVNYGTRGRDSGKDQELVERLGRSSGIETKILKPDKRGTPGRCRGTGGNFPSGFEAKARDVRNDFLKKLAAECGAGNIVFAHTADEQVETILMRFFEGAGIAGLKGIPRETEDGIVRPILHIWKEDILKYLKENKIPYRVDRSNSDTRFERNWIRHVLIPLLEKRYGKMVKKRIFTLGERFRELDDYLETEARNWIRRNMEDGKRSGRGEGNVDKIPTRISTPAQRKRVERGKAKLPREDGASTGREGTPGFPRGSFSLLPTAVRVKILQRICFDRLGLAPNERLLVSMDRVVRVGGPNARVRAGRGWELVNRYERSAFVPSGDVRRGAEPSGSPAVGRTAVVLEVEEKGRVTPAQARRAAASGRKEYFDAAGIHLPLTVRTIRAGDRIRPFGLDSEKKVKEILIDRKVPRDDRWGRPVVCDADGKILWIPGVVRSAHAPVTPATRKTVRVRIRREPVSRSRK